MERQRTDLEVHISNSGGDANKVIPDMWKWYEPEEPDFDEEWERVIDNSVNDNVVGSG